MRSAIGKDRPDARSMDEDRDLKILGVRRVGNFGCIILMAVRTADQPRKTLPWICAVTPTRLLIP